LNIFDLLKDAVQFKLTNVICESLNESWVHIYDCRLKAISRNLTVFNFNATFFYPVNDIILEMQLFKRANGYKPWLLKTAFDSCRSLRTTFNPFGKLVYNLYKNYSNINHTCPFEGPIIIKGFHVEPDKLGLPLPTGQYRLDTKWLFEKKLQLKVNAYFAFTENV
ncbi:hypothetical protein KR044_012590, partial [Drosophila immigrans]